MHSSSAGGGSTVNDEEHSGSHKQQNLSKTVSDKTSQDLITAMCFVLCSLLCRVEELSTRLGEALISSGRECIPYVCPEPVLVKRSFLNIQMAQKDCVRSGELLAAGDLELEAANRAKSSPHGAEAEGYHPRGPGPLSGGGGGGGRQEL